jgi:hypothetical protein
MTSEVLMSISKFMMLCRVLFWQCPALKPYHSGNRGAPLNSSYCAAK